MALQLIDGFDHYATSDLPKKGWVLTGNSTNRITLGTTGRRQGGALSLAASGLATSAFASHPVPAVTTVVMGVAVKPGVTTGGVTLLVLWDSVGNIQATLKMTASGNLALYRGDAAAPSFSGVLLGTSSATLPAGGYSYVEWKYTVDLSAGATELRVNGSSWLSLSGIRTLHSYTNAMTNVAAVGFGFSNGPNIGSLQTVASFDDLYVLDTAGSVNTTFLGDCRVDTLVPQADGTHTDFTPSTGTVHYALVDDPVPDASDYVSSATVGAIDSYTCTALSNLSATVYGVQLAAACSKDDAGLRFVANLVRSGSTEATGATAGVATSLAYNLSVHETDPATSAAWTPAAINGAQFGVKLVL